MKVKINNMTGRTGRPVANQFIITTPEGIYFQSYTTIIVFKPYGKKPILDTCSWNYSRTTGKYRNKFLRESKKETEKKINSGAYLLADLN